MKNYYKSFLIGLVAGLLTNFIPTSTQIWILVVIISGLISGFIVGRETKIGIINGVISSLGFPIAVVIFYTVRLIEGFSSPIIPILIISLTLILIVSTLLGAFGGLIGSYIKKSSLNKN